MYSADPTPDSALELFAAGPSALEKLLKIAPRYGLSALGPVCTSGAHLLGAVLILHTMSPVHFGLFSFVTTIVLFCISAAQALVGVSTIIGIREHGSVDDAQLATF